MDHACKLMTFANKCTLCIQLASSKISGMRSYFMWPSKWVARVIISIHVYIIQHLKSSLQFGRIFCLLPHTSQWTLNTQIRFRNILSVIMHINVTFTGGGGYSQSESDFSSQMSNADTMVKAKLLKVTVKRPWFKSSLFKSKSLFCVSSYVEL